MGAKIAIKKEETAQQMPKPENCADCGAVFQTREWGNTVQNSYRSVMRKVDGKYISVKLCKGGCKSK